MTDKPMDRPTGIQKLDGASEKNPNLRVGVTLLLVSIIEDEKEKDGAESGEKDAEKGVFDVAMALSSEHALHVHVTRRSVNRKHVNSRRAVRMLDAHVSGIYQWITKKKAWR